MYRKMFYIALAIGLVLNLLVDLNIYQIGRTAINTGDWVNYSYNVLQTIDKAKLKILESQLKLIPSPELPDIFQNIVTLVSDMPPQKARADELLKLSGQQILEQKHNQGLIILSEMTATEQSLLHDRLNRDRQNNSEGVNTVLFSNIVDMLMIFVAFILFQYDRKLNARLQKSLTAALAHVESVNQSLLHTLFKTEKKFKTAVHDLKNPLGSISGFADLLQDESGNSKSVFEMTQIIQRISKNTLNLVGSILENENDDLSVKEPVQMLDCIRETCDFLEPTARSKRQKIQIENEACSFTFLVSRQQIQDVFYNIVGNALKFSPYGSVVSISCIDDGSFHTVKIKDQGPGFTEEDFSKMFIPGAKLSARPSAGEISTGIGLLSVKQTLDYLHGQIEITNNIDSGACVAIRFPLI